MAKLRLIRPWALYPVRQRLTVEAQPHAAVCLQPCSGPVVIIEDVCIARYSLCNIRTAKVATERSLARHALSLCEVPKTTSLNPRF
jgi:hypothetical protein